MTSIHYKPHFKPRSIDSKAFGIVERLQSKGFKAYLVGGCVRDLLVGQEPKDFDIATNAEPNQVKRIIPFSYVIGRRFRLVLVKRDNQQFEVATFRREASVEEVQAVESDEADTRKSLDNFFGTPEQDAIRRDFTVNALFYDPIENLIIDYAEGLADIATRTLRMIGDPHQRITEDPIRSLRAVRLSHKLRFRIDPELRAKIMELAPLLTTTALPRRREEFLKILKQDSGPEIWMELFDLGLIHSCLPDLVPILESNDTRLIFFEALRLPLFPKDQELTPSEYFAPLMLGLDMAFNPRTIPEGLLKNQLGLSKLEIAHTDSALQMMDGFLNKESFLKRGTRRQAAFVGHENFDLSLQLSHLTGKISALEKEFWIEQKLKLLS